RSAGPITALQPARANTSINFAIFWGVSNCSRINRSLAALVCEQPSIQLVPQIRRGMEMPPTIVRGKSVIVVLPFPYSPPLLPTGVAMASVCRRVLFPQDFDNSQQGVSFPVRMFEGKRATLFGRRGRCRYKSFGCALHTDWF